MIPVFLFFIGFGSVVYQKALAVPPEACFAPFRRDDCGKPPKAVMYYYKPGSRCEIGFWRGCLPNLNMFADEYECVRTCIFVDRAGEEDYHNKNKGDEQVEEEIVDATEPSNTTDTADTNATTAAGAADETGAGGDATDGGATDGGASPDAPTEAPAK